MAEVIYVEPTDPDESRIMYDACNEALTPPLYPSRAFPAGNSTRQTRNGLVVFWREPDAEPPAILWQRTDPATGKLVAKRFVRRPV